MKTSNRSKFHKGGYAALLSTVSLSLTIMAFAITSFRETRHSHLVQTRNQVKLDYSQKERAFLRSLLDIVPNTAMLTMAKNSANNQDNLNWPAIFKEALTKAQINQSLDPATAESLGISIDVVSSNTGDSNFIPANFIASPNSSGQPAMEDSHLTRPANLILPPLMQFVGGGNNNSDTAPIINFNKRLTSNSPLYTKMPYPEIAFGYSAQGSDFLAKRNWWAFTVNFGAESAAITGIAPSPRTYVLSIYEVPTQLAISSSGSTTSLGKFDSGTAWHSGITIAGSIYTDKAVVHDLNAVQSIASRGGIALSSNAPSGQSIGGTKERRKLRATTTDNTFYPYSSSSDSGLVSFTPINRGTDFFDYFADSTLTERTSTLYYTVSRGTTTHQDYLSYHYDNNSVNSRTWSEYSIGARQTKMQVTVGRTTTTAQLPDRLFITARFNGDTQSRRQQTSRNAWWRTETQTGYSGNNQSWPETPDGADWFIQTSNLNGRPALTLDLEKLPQFLIDITADDVTINNSIWIGPKHGTSNVTEAGNTINDTILIIQKSTDLSAYTNGLTIITPYTVYFDDDFNDVPVATPPPGQTSPWYPPISVYAPDKRFGTQSAAGKIQLDGQIGYLPDSTNTNTVSPLDLKNGATNNATPSNIAANLKGITETEDLPPINAMSWLTVIEEIR